MRFDSIPPTPELPLGQGPFRVRGSVYVASIRYVTKKVPGGMEATLRALADDPYRPFFDQIFVAGSSYDVSPLVRLTQVVSGLQQVAPARFSKQRGRESAEIDIRGIYRLVLLLTSPETMASRLPRAFNRYFEPCRAELKSLNASRLEAEFTLIPERMAGWYVHSTEGFVERALELAGARGLRFQWGRPHADTPMAGFATWRIPLTIEWR